MWDLSQEEGELSGDFFMKDHMLTEGRSPLENVTGVQVGAKDPTAANQHTCHGQRGGAVSVECSLAVQSPFEGHSSP